MVGEKHSRLVQWISYPGLMLQKPITREPDDSQLEVAIAALKALPHKRILQKRRDMQECKTEANQPTDKTTESSSFTHFIRGGGRSRMPVNLEEALKKRQRCLNVQRFHTPLDAQVLCAMCFR